MAGGVDQDLDDILNSALEEFDDDLGGEAKEEGGLDETVAEAAKRSEGLSKDSQADEMAQNVARLMKQMENPDFNDTLEKTFRELSGDGEGAHSLPGLMNPFAEANSSTGENENEINSGIAQTLEMLASSAKDMEGLESNAVEQMGEDMMTKMMGEFEKMGEKEDFQKVVEGMMRQMLSRDVMYAPMKQICEKFPEWLAENEPKLAQEDYLRYGKQYQFFQRIVALYETEPDNYERLVELMQDMQETGQPPAEIIKELAPGLEFGEDGMPVMPNMGPGMMPTVPGMPAMPNMPTMPGQDGQQCVVM